jgi:hypothetical protein
MTRRDYCALCITMVHDYDPLCICGKSFCYSCPIAVNDVSQMALLHSKVRVMTSPVFTLDDIANILNIKSSEIINHCITYFLDLSDYDTHFHKLNTIYDEFKQQLVALLNVGVQDELSKQTTTIINTFFVQLEEYVASDIEFTFTCNECYNNC